MPVRAKGDDTRCRWCGRGIPQVPGPGRRKLYCKHSHKVRWFEALRRAGELGLTEQELVVQRDELEALRDAVYVLEAAVEDVERDIADDDSPAEVRRALDWLIAAAKPLVEASH